MECHLFRMLIQKYYDGELDAVERAEYENHRRLCEGCRAMDRRVAGVFEALGEIPLLEPSGDFNRAVLARVDISRYRVGAIRRAFRALGGAWALVPVPIRAGGAIAAVFMLFITAYRPLLFFLISMSEKASTYIGASLFILREMVKRSGTVIKYWSSSTNYRVAGETLLRTFQRVAAGVPLYHIGIAIVVLLIILLVTVRTARVAWRRGETHVGVL